MIKKSHQVTFWLLVFISLNLLFGSRWNNFLDAFYFTTMLFPVAIATSYFFNFILVPRYLSKGRTLKFGLYTIYTIIVSAFLSMSIAMLAFIILADLKWHDVNPIVGDVFQLGLLIYFITILFSFIHLYFTHLNQKTQLTELQIQQNKNKLQAITIRSNRKSVNILVKDIHYIESLSDYVKIYTEQNTILTKEKISHLEKTLPEHFVRIHRSFLINNYNVEGFGHDYVHVHDQKLPIGRKYKKSALSQIGQA